MTRAATTTPPVRRPARARRSARRPDLDGVQHIVLENASWALYEQLLRDIGDRPIRINYDQGRLEMMSPLPEHEEAKQFLHDLIRTLTLEVDVEMKCLGSTTFKHAGKRKGVEPDDCYYFKHAARMRGRKRLNLAKDPVPELVVEIDITSPSVPREPIYAALGVPELWRYDGRKIECLELVNGVYRPRAKSIVFPFLSPSDLMRFIRMLATRGDNAVLRKFRDWVRSREG